MSALFAVRSLAIIALAALAMAAPAAAAAQTLASVQGVVRDASDAVIVEVDVTMTNLDTAQVRQTRTAADGTFQLLGVAPGPYRLTAARAGFTPWTRELVLTIDQQLKMTAVLTIAAQQEDITVRGRDVPLVEPSRVSLGRTIRTEDIDGLPLRAAGPYGYVALAPLTPGVTSVSVANGTVSNIVTAGQPNTANSIYVDGASMEGMGLSSGPPTIAVQEYRVVTNHHSVEFGQTSGLLLNTLTRSGSNRSTARLAYSGQHSAWNAPSHTLTLVPGAVDPGRSQHALQGFWGGPLVPNRAFLFAAGEYIAINTVYVNTSPYSELFRPGEPTTMPVQTRIPKPYARVDLHRQGHLVTGSVNYQRIQNDNAAREDLSTRERGRRLDDRSLDIAARYSAVLGGSAVNEVRGKWSANRFDRSVDEFCPGCLALNYNEAILLGKPPNEPQLRLAEHASLAEVLTWMRADRSGRHTIVAGVTADVLSVHQNQAQNVIGSYRFPQPIPFDPENPDSYPNQFTQTAGNPETRVRQAVFAAFVQDDWQPRDGLSLNVGVRWDRTRWPEPSGLRNDVAPRLGVAFDPWKRGVTVFRAAAGRYYDKVNLEIARAGEANFETLTITNPGFQGDLRVFDPWAPSRRPGARRTTVSTNEHTATQTPYADQASVGVQRQIGRHVAITADVVRALGRRQPIRRDLNYPDPITHVRPDPDPTILQKVTVETTAHSWYTGLQVGVERRLANRYGYTVAYTWSAGENDTSGFCNMPQCFAADQNNVVADRGPSLTDARHQATASATIDVGFGVRLAAVLSGRSGMPYNVTTGADDNRDGVINDRPDGTGRNSARGAAAFQADVRLSRPFALRGARVELIAEAFNLTNHANWIDYDGVTSHGDRFGTPRDALPPRQIQLGVRIDFR